MKIPSIAPGFQKEYKRICNDELRSLVNVLISEFDRQRIIANKTIQRYAFVFSQPSVEIVHIAFFVPERKGFHIRLFCCNDKDFEFNIGCFQNITKNIQFSSWFDGVDYKVFDDFFFDIVLLVKWVQN